VKNDNKIYALTTTPMSAILVHSKLNVKLSFMRLMHGGISFAACEEFPSGKSASGSRWGRQSISLGEIPEPFLGKHT
jgi:hypothetical protein